MKQMHWWTVLSTFFIATSVSGCVAPVKKPDGENGVDQNSLKLSMCSLNISFARKLYKRTRKGYGRPYKPSKLTLTKPNEFSYMAFLLNVMTEDNPPTLCSAVIVTPKWALTAAHCIKGANYGVVAVGSNNIKLTTPVVVGKYVIHPKFASTNGTYENDLGLVMLTKSIPMNNPRFSVAVLPEAGQSFPTLTAQVVGWNWYQQPKKNGTYRVERRLRKLTVITATCKSNICVKGLSSQACLGDSGGPLVIGGVVFGIQSQRRNLNPKTDLEICNDILSYDVFMPVEKYLDWITMVTKTDVKEVTKTKG